MYLKIVICGKHPEIWQTSLMFAGELAPLLGKHTRATSNLLSLGLLQDPDSSCGR